MKNFKVIFKLRGRWQLSIIVPAETRQEAILTARTLLLFDCGRFASKFSVLDSAETTEDACETDEKVSRIAAFRTVTYGPLPNVKNENTPQG